MSQREKVRRAREIARAALGDAARSDQPQAIKYVPLTKSPEPIPVTSEAIGVLLITEAATRLGISTAEMEAMVKSGKVKTLMAGWTVVVPTSEVEKLRSEFRQR